MADIFISGIGRKPPRIFNEELKETEKQLTKLRKYKPKFEKYEVIDTKHLFSITMETNTLFQTLKSRVEAFNRDIKQAIIDSQQIPLYNWKIVLYQGLRNLLRSVCNTDDFDMQIKLLNKADEWYHDQILRKEAAPAPDKSKIARPRSVIAQPPRDEASNKESVKARPMIQTPEPLPSTFQADILRDYESGARSKHDSSLPPYEKYAKSA